MAKVRVHELAKELGIESRVVLAKLREMGEFVRSSSSPLDPPVVRRFQDRYGDQLRGWSPPRSTTPPRRRARTERPYGRQSRSLQPSAPPDRNLLDASRIFGVPVEELKPRREDRPGSRYASSDSRRKRTAWDEHWIDPEERRAWIGAGLGPDDGRIAGQLKDRGVMPDDLQQKIDGVRVNERLRSGESVGSVVGRLREYKRNRDVG